MKRLWRWLIFAAFTLAVLVAATAWVLALPQFGDRADGERLARMRANPQYREGAFVNPVPPAERTAADTWMLMQRQFGGDEVRVPPKPLPMQAVAAITLTTALSAAPGLRAFWIGHASVYVEIDGLRLLVDPIFSEYASPFNAGPRRFYPPPIALQDLPAIDAVLITHDHYDHLDMRTVQPLAARGTRFFVPLGIGAHLQRWGVPAAQISEFAWWQEQVLQGVRFVCTPSRHYSGRSLNDKNATLWSSWAVLGAKHRFYVSGDTGYADHFSRIGERLGPFDLSFIKIGAYGPSQSWVDIHMSAEDAVRAHQDVRGKRMFPVHWGTFNLAFHDWDEPIKRAQVAASAARVDLLTPRLGEAVDADQPFVSSAWWEAVR